ncbi:MAG: hypothetical protein KIT09_28510 [Bryobacteraceae bacterium]|nr:hypothetical protein [Bryobacteraceae bacterium]
MPIGMPDLNFDEPEIRREIKAVAKFWLEKGIDGFRLDAAKHIYGDIFGPIRARWLMLPRHTQPEKDVQAMLDHLHLTLPSQPQPRIRASQLPQAPAPAPPAQPSLW